MQNIGQNELKPMISVERGNDPGSGQSLIGAVDKAILGTLLILGLTLFFRWFSSKPGLESLTDAWGFKRPGATAFARELMSRSSDQAFPLVFESAYRALETPGELTSDSSEGALLFLFWYAGQQSKSLTDRKIAGTLFLSRLPQHPDLNRCGFAVLNSVERMWSPELVKELLPTFQGFFLQFHRVLSAGSSPDLVSRLEQLSFESLTWKAIRPPELPPSSPFSETGTASDLVQEASPSSFSEEIMQ